MRRRRKTPADTAERRLRLRAGVVVGFFCLLFAAIFARAVQLQVIESEDLKKRAASQHTRTVTVSSKRGDIYDRNLRELAVSIKADSVYAQASRVSSKKRAAAVLSPILSEPRSSILKKLSSARGFVWLKRQVELTGEQRKAIASLGGVGVIKESKRYYPNGTLASNLLGFTGVDSRGLEGLELYYDNVLKGSTVKVVGERDATGGLLLYEDLDKKVPLEGMAVELTIDKTIQYITEKALERAVTSTEAKAGMAVVMDPFTGEVLAMAVRPGFDPNDYGRYGPTKWRNRAVTDVFEPGSVFKMFLMAAALEEDIVDPMDIIWCENGRYRVADRVFHDTHKHGWLSVPQILKYSSNIGSAKIGEKVGKNRLYRYLRAFGFGGDTGVDLPGESSGLLRSPSRWSKVTVDTVSFGQGVSTTAMQLTAAAAAIANGGFVMKPYVVKSVKDPDGRVISESHPVVKRRAVSSETASTVRRMLVGVTSPEGTGHKASIKGFEVAGKTATAQKPDFRNGGYTDEYISSFLGFVPADSPRLTILVVVDEPLEAYHGGEVAAPAFKEIASQALPYLGVFPERAEGGGAARVVRASAPASRIAPAGVTPASVVPDFRGMSMRAVLKAARERSLDVKLAGSGKAFSQKPGAGTRPPEDGPVTVWFR